MTLVVNNICYCKWQCDKENKPFNICYHCAGKFLLLLISYAFDAQMVISHVLA